MSAAGCLTRMRHIPCERDEALFFSVGAVCLKDEARLRMSRNSAQPCTWRSSAPASCVTPDEFSRIEIGFRELSKS